MRSLFAKLARWWPIGLLVLGEVAVFATNYTPGTWLMGWDNVMPEFHFRQALMTNLYGVWQEHRGLGLYDGMGHAANLIHTLFLWLLSFFIPTSALRYSFHFLMHLVGGIGAYVLIKKLLSEKWVALTGSLFYLFNLATIQMFYTPLEAFSVHYASLPWLAWSVMDKRLRAFLLISLLSTPQFFIPTLLLPVGILLGSISSFTQGVKRTFFIACTFLLINAFWLLPYLYGLPHNAPVIREAKINQMSSEEVFTRNQAFGNLGNVLRLRGFPIDFEDTAQDGTTTFLMAPWRTFLEQPLAQLGSWSLVAVTLLGAGANLFALPFIASFLFLANNTPAIRELTAAIRDSAPVLAEAYRFPFTKFSLLFALSSSVFLAVGLTRIARGRLLPMLVSVIVILLAAPVFGGHFFSDRLRVALPEDYPRLFAFMKGRPMGRIAYLPAHQYWSWKYYDWGYRGSGFLWYGLPQPLLDRAFDPWSGYNENYYWEISRSIYSKDVAAFDAALNKYDVRYVLLDEHLISPSHNRALFTEEIKAMLAGLPQIREITRFGKLTVYERWIPDQVGDDITIKTNLPLVSPAYQWTDNDVAYRELGDYINEPGGYTYPFRSLFTKRSVHEREFTVSDILTDALVYDSTKSADLVAENVKPCGINNSPLPPLSVRGGEGELAFLRFISRGARGCLSFSLGNLPHTEGYLVAVESRHITGRPLLFSLINQTAKHVELETYLERETSYFILPPLASDGLGYSAYIANDAIGRQETINDLRAIRVYRIPYQELVSMRTPGEGTNNKPTLIVYQSFDPGWTAWERIPTFPYVRQLNDHVLVNNWANGWRLTTYNTQPTTIILFFLPQLLQWLGFAFLPLLLLFFTAQSRDA